MRLKLEFRNPINRNLCFSAVISNLTVLHRPRFFSYLFGRSRQVNRFVVANAFSFLKKIVLTNYLRHKIFLSIWLIQTEAIFLAVSISSWKKVELWVIFELMISGSPVQRRTRAYSMNSAIKLASTNWLPKTWAPQWSWNFRR